MGKCLVTTFKKRAENSGLKKYGELRLKAINDGNLTIRTYYGDAVLRLVSGSASIGGEEITPAGKTLAQSTLESKVTLTNGTILAIDNKYALDVLVTSVMELTDGFTLESLYYSAFERIGLAGNTSGSITGLDVTKLKYLLLDNTKAEGNLDIFADSTVVKRIQIRNTKISGNLSNLTGKSLESTCHFDGSSLSVDLADISSMASGLNTVSKYQNCYLYGDASSLAASEHTIGAQQEAKVMPFTWLTQRHDTSGAYILGNQSISGTMFINYGTYLDAMLIDQAQCTASSSSTKTIIVYGTHTDSSGWETAVATLKSNGYTVTINGETL